MKRVKSFANIVTTYILFISLAQASGSQLPFSPEQEAKIGEIAANYLVAHPEVLVSVSQRLQQQQKQREQMSFAVSVMENQATLLNDAATPVYGPDNAQVAVIEFFDYQCTYCIAMAPELQKVMKTHPEVRYVFKEWPIFSGSRENSLLAAQRGLAVWKEKGAEAYVTYHNAVLAAGRDSGAVTKENIEEAAVKAGWQEKEKTDFRDVIAGNDELARTLGLSGTPGIIVMPTKAAMPNNITVFPGKVSAEMLEKAIRKAGD